MKTYVVTGASDGIGKSIAQKLSLLEESRLILLGRDLNRLKSTQEICQKNSSTAEIYAFDLNDDQARQAAVNEIIEKYAPDVLINVAGVWQKAGDLTTLDNGTIRLVIDTNLTSQILLVHQMLDFMRNREGSAIINIVSKSGLIAQAGQSVYTASKYGMKGFTDVLRIDTKDDLIHVAGVYQSGTRTKMFAKVGEEMQVDKFTEPDDLADIVVFMLTRPNKIWLNEIHIDR